MECEECEASQRDSVLALGRDIVPLAAGFLLAGPPQSRVDSLEASLRRRHARLRAYARTHADFHLPPEADYVAVYVAGYQASYRSRSAVLLGLLGGAEARSALEEALTQDPSSHLAKTIRFAIDSLWAP
jgi:hypothetical protein